MLPIYFAPLQGYTEYAYRRIHHQLIGGVAEYFTPFLRLEHNEVRKKNLRDILPENNIDVPVTPQIIAKGAAELEKILQVVLQLGYTRIDINMGCPFPLQTGHGRGAGILPFPEKVTEIAQVIKDHPNIAFSVKMRLGMDSTGEWREVLPILNDTPLRHITLHSRVAQLQYKGVVDMESFKDFLRECQHPVIYNGDVRTHEDIQRIESQFPELAGIMIGRGLLARPTLAEEYQEHIEFSPDQELEAILKLHHALLSQYRQIFPDDQQQMLKIRTFWDYMEPTIGHKVWKKLRKAGNMKNYQQISEELCEK